MWFFSRVRVRVNHVFSIVVKTRYIVHQTIYITSLALFIVFEYPCDDLWPVVGIPVDIDADVRFHEHCGQFEVRTTIAVALPMTNFERIKRIFLGDNCDSRYLPQRCTETRRVTGK